MTHVLYYSCSFLYFQTLFAALHHVVCVSLGLLIGVYRIYESYLNVIQDDVSFYFISIASTAAAAAAARGVSAVTL